MASGVVVFCAALLLVLPSASAVEMINSIDNLKRIGSETSVFRQTIVLLHWFANTVDISNGVIYLTFDPQEDYCSHHYGNYDGLLHRLPRGYTYFTVGNINDDTRQQLPRHIRNPRTTGYNRNSARIIFRVHAVNLGWQGTRQVVDQVFVTQHDGHGGTQYDREHTYQISLNLFRQIRQFPMRGNSISLRNLRAEYRTNVDDNELRNIELEWKDLACLGLLLFIVFQPVRFNNQSYNRPQYETHRSAWSDECRDCCLVFIFILVAFIVFAVYSVANNKIH